MGTARGGAGRGTTDADTIVLIDRPHYALRIGIGVGDQGRTFITCRVGEWLTLSGSHRHCRYIDTPVLVAFCARSPHGVSAVALELVGVATCYRASGGRAFGYRAVERRLCAPAVTSVVESACSGRRPAGHNQLAGRRINAGSVTASGVARRHRHREVGDHRVAIERRSRHPPW